MKVARADVVVAFPPPDTVPCDEIRCLLNPLQAIDLKQILLMTPADRRMAVASAFAGLDDVREAFMVAGLASKQRKGSNGDVHWRRWMNRSNRMPMGAGFRLAALFGVPAELLLEWYS